MDVTDLRLYPLIFYADIEKFDMLWYNDQNEFVGCIMFDNIGDKIKTLAKVVCWIGIIACIITGIVLMATDEDLVLAGILTAVLGSILSWVSSFVLYGFGQLVENSDIIAKQSARNNEKHSKKVQQQQEQQRKDKVKAIKTAINDANVSEDTYIDIICPNCGESLSYTKQELMANKTLICPMCDAEISTLSYR